MTYDIHKIFEQTGHISRLGSVDEVAESLSHLLKKTVKSRWAAVYLLDSEKLNFLPVRIKGVSRSHLPMFHEQPLKPEEIPVIRKLMQKKKPLVITGSTKFSFLSLEIRKLLQHLTLLLLPMIVRNQVIGAVIVARSSSYPPFSDKEIAVIRETVGHSALAVSHIRLLDESLDMAVEMGRRVDVILTLDEINKAISSSLSPATIIETAMEHIERIMQCELVVILEEHNGELVVLASRGVDITLPDAFNPGSLLHGECLAYRAFSSSQTCYMQSMDDNKQPTPGDKALAEAGIQSAMAIPLVSREATRGVLLLGDKSPGQFSGEDTFTIEKIAGQMAVALENARHYQQMRSLFISTVSSLANAIDAKSPWTKGHSERVMEISTTIARELGLSDEQVERVRLCGLLHDIGKIGIIEDLLDKPALLSEDEFPPMRLHPEKGVAILEPIEQLHDILPGILYHHERIDGTGYPKGLMGDAIPLEAKIIAVADSFDAMISERPYKAALQPQQALKELEKEAGTQFDARVVACFCDHLKRKLDL